MQTLPSSSASIERLFSELGNIVTVKRNRLSVENIEACLYIRQEYKENKNYFKKEMYNMYYQAYTNDFSESFGTKISLLQGDISFLKKPKILQKIRLQLIVQWKIWRVHKTRDQSMNL